LKHAGEVTRLFQIFLADEQAPTYKVWLCAWQDRALEQYWEKRFITEAATADELRDSIGDWLNEGFAELFRWSAHDLTFATTLGAPA
jgi:hypothetical protein